MPLNDTKRLDQSVQEGQVAPALQPDASEEGIDAAFLAIDFSKLDQLPTEIREKLEVALIGNQIARLAHPDATPEDHEVNTANVIQQLGGMIAEGIRRLRSSADKVLGKAAL